MGIHVASRREETALGAVDTLRDTGSITIILVHVFFKERGGGGSRENRVKGEEEWVARSQIRVLRRRRTLLRKRVIEERGEPSGPRRPEEASLNVGLRMRRGRRHRLSRIRETSNLEISDV